MQRLGLALLTLSVLFVPMVAQAGKYDINYNRFGTLESGPLTQEVFKDQDGFDKVVRDLGIALAPSYFGPAASLGALGFDLAYEIALTDINENAQHWQDALPEGTLADDMLIAHRLRLRKGLPFSMEVGGSLAFLQDSDFTTVGLDLKYAAVEGFRLLPDLAFRTNIHTVLGASDVHMLLTGGDVILSKEFGVAGLFRLSPHIGYNLVYVYGSSHQITFFNDSCGEEELKAGRCSRLDLFDDVGEFEHRGIVGLSFVGAYISLGGEVAIGPEIRTYTGHFGVDF